MLGTDDGELVFVGFSPAVREGFGEPVRGTNESGLRVDRIGALLLACSECRFVDSCGAREAVGGKIYGGRGGGGIGGRIVHEDF